MKNHSGIIFVGRLDRYLNHFRNESHTISMGWLCFHVHCDVNVFNTCKERYFGLTKLNFQLVFDNMIRCGFYHFSYLQGYLKQGSFHVHF